MTRTPNEDEVLVLVGAGAIGLAIARRLGANKTVLLASIDQDRLHSEAETLDNDGYRVTTQPVDVSSRESVRSLAQFAATLGSVVQVVATAGLSPVQASPEAILAVDLVGTAIFLDEFATVIARGGSGLVISSMAGYMMPALHPDQDHALAQTPTDELLQLPMLSSDAVTNSGAAYAIAKRANHLRVQAAAIPWGDRGARINSMSPASSSPHSPVTRWPAPAQRTTSRSSTPLQPGAWAPPKKLRPPQHSSWDPTPPSSPAATS